MFLTFLTPVLTVRLSVTFNTRKSQEPSAWRFTKTITERQSENLTEASPAPVIDTYYVTMVFYTTVALISVFVICSLIYGFSYLRKISNSREKNITVTETGSSLYECVDFPHQI